MSPRTDPRLDNEPRRPPTPEPAAQRQVASLCRADSIHESLILLWPTAAEAAEAATIPWCRPGCSNNHATVEYDGIRYRSTTIPVTPTESETDES